MLFYKLYKVRSYCSNLVFNYMVHSPDSETMQLSPGTRLFHASLLSHIFFHLPHSFIPESVYYHPLF